MATSAIFSKCTPAIRTDIKDCGTITACKAIIPQPGELDTMFANSDGDYYLMEALFMTQFDLALNDVQQSPFEKFLMSNHVNVSKRLTKQVIGEGQERIQPYILGFRKGVLNNVQWFGANGNTIQANDAVGTDWRMTVTSPTNIPRDVKWFNTGDYVYIIGLTDAGVQISAQYRILGSRWVGADLTTSGTTHLVIMLDALNSASFLDDAKVVDPVKGIIFRGPNNYSDFESYCETIPGLIAGNEEPFWFQTSRGPILCTDSLTEEYRDLILKGNPLFAKYYALPLTEYNRQVGEDWNRRMCEGYMYNKPLPGQSLTDYMKTTGNGGLADITITDFISGSRCIGKRANAIGWYEQHAQRGRVVDLQGGRLSIPSLANSIYKMMQIREAAGMKNVDTWDIGVPGPMMPLFQRAFMAYWKARGVTSYDKMLDPKYEQTGSLGFKFRTFNLEWPDVELRVITDRYFDHTLDIATKLGIQLGDPRYANLGRRIFLLPWQYNYCGILGSKRVVNSSGTLAERAKITAADRCKMAVEEITTTMTSTTWCPISELPEAGLIIENIGGDVPDDANEGGDYEAGTCQEDSVLEFA